LAPDGDPARAPFFVMAHHRSGSNFLTDLLQAHPQLECINEPLSMHTRHFRECDLATWTAPSFDPDTLHPSIAAHESLRAFLLEFRAYLLSSSRRRVVGFKDTVLFGKLAWLHAFLPTLKVVFLRREPRSIVSSLLRSRQLDFWNFAPLVPPAFERLFPGVMPARTVEDGATRAAEIATMSVVLRYALANRELGLFEHRAVDLERLVSRPETVLEGLADFLGVPHSAAPLAFFNERSGARRGGSFSSFRRPEDVAVPWKRDLSTAQVDAVERILAATQAAPAAAQARDRAAAKA
jgi:hypothetical protein